MRVVAAAIGIAFVATLAAGGSSSPAGSTVLRVSAASPFAACTTSDQPGRNWGNAEVEPRVAGDPSSPGHLIGVWQQDRWSNGGSNGIVAARSADGGVTWARTTLPFDRCAGGLGYRRASDPCVSIGPDGRAYATALAETNPPHGPNTIVAATSSDGGQTWNRVRRITASADGDADFNDKDR